MKTFLQAVHDESREIVYRIESPEVYSTMIRMTKGISKEMGGIGHNVE